MFAGAALAAPTIDVTPTIDGQTIDNGPIVLQSGQTVRLGVRLSDRSSGFPLGDLHPAFWVRPAVEGRDECPVAVDRYLALGPNAGIDDDLNGYLFATLNRDHSIAVMDPKLNLATSNLLSLSPRATSADAWWLDQTTARLFIASAEADQLETIDLLSGDHQVVIDDLDGAGSIAAFPALDRLWVAGETQIDAISLEKNKRIRTSAMSDGAWQIEADAEGLRLLALDHQSGRFLVLHPESGVIEQEVAFGGERGMFVHDPRADAIYVLGDARSSLERLFLDAERPSHHPLPVAVDQLLLTEDSDWLAGLNSRDGSLVLIDAASLRPVHVLQFDGKPSQMQASDDYLYLLENGTGYVSIVHLPSLNAERSPGVLRVPIGPAAVAGGDGRDTTLRSGSAPSAIAPLIEGGGAIIASPSDKSLYLYMETGMQAPANAFKSWTSPPEAIALLDRQPKEHRAGVYETAYRPKRPGAFELVVFLPNPKIVRCMAITVEGEGERMAETLKPPRLVWTKPETPIIAGAPIELQFKLDPAASGHGAAAGRPADVLAMASGRNWHWRGRAAPLGADRFSVSLTLPEPGDYQLLVRLRDRHLDFQGQQPFSLNVVADW
jgi:hypothetical protein